ncbi:MAG: hypothetical protein ABFS30_00035 [Pseudomonadota bacterium]
MRKLAEMIMAGVALGACTGAPGGERSCADLAQTRAAEQMERETALLEQQELGRPNKSDPQRKFIAMDAETYRTAVYEECLRRRGLAAAGD